MTLDVGLVCQNVVRRDGQGRVMLELARAVLERGHRVTVYAHRLDDELAGRVRFRRVWSAPGPQLVDDLVFLGAATRAVRRASHDVVCAVGPMVLPSSPFVLNLQFSHRGWRRTWTMDTRPGLYHRVHARVLEALESLCGRRADRVIASTADLGREVVADGVEKVVVVPNGIDLHEFSPSSDVERSRARRRLGLEDDAFVVGFLGGWSTPRKGLDPLLRAVALGRTDERLLLASGGPRRRLDARLESLGIRDRVVVAGFERPQAVFPAVDVVAVPSLYEPFSLVALEAVASGVPLVVAERAGAAPLLRDAALVVGDPSDPTELRGALDTVRADPDVRGRMATAGRRAVEGLAWPVLFDAAAAVLEDVARPRTSTSQRAEG